MLALANALDGLSRAEAARLAGLERRALRDAVTATAAAHPVEPVWLFLRERCLSLPVLTDHRAIIGACCQAWNRLAAEPGRIRSLCDQSWITKAIS